MSKSKTKTPVMRPSKKYVFFALLAIVAAVVVLFTFGLAPSRDHSTYKVYSVVIPYTFDEELLPLLRGRINDVAGAPCEVELASELLNDSDIILITTYPAANLNEHAIVTMLNNEYPDMKVDALLHATYAPAFTWTRAISLLAVYAIMLIALYIIAAFLVDGKNAFAVLCSVFLAGLVTAAMYVLCRVPSVNMLIATELMVFVATAYLSLAKVRTLRLNLQKMKKPVSATVSGQDIDATGIAGVDILVIAALLATGLGTVGIIKSQPYIAYYGVMLFVGFAAAVYMATLVAPVLWAGMNKK